MNYEKIKTEILFWSFVSLIFLCVIFVVYSWYSIYKAKKQTDTIYTSTQKELNEKIQTYEKFWYDCKKGRLKTTENTNTIIYTANCKYND